MNNNKFKNKNNMNHNDDSNYKTNNNEWSKTLENIPQDDKSWAGVLSNAGFPTWEEIQGRNFEPPTKEDLLVPDDISSLIDYVGEKILHFLKPVTSGLGSNNHLVSVMISTISSSLISMITNLILWRSIKEKSLAVKISTALNVTINLTSIVNTIGFICTYHWKTSFMVSKALSLIQPLTDKLLSSSVKPNSGNIMISWLKPIVSVLSILVMGGITAFSTVQLKDLMKIGNFIDVNNKVIKSTTNFTEWFMEKVCGIDITGNVAQHDAIITRTIKSAELLMIPMYKLVLDSELREDYFSFYEESIKEVNKITNNKDISNMTRQASQSLTNNLSVLLERKEFVTTILNEKQRPQTLAVLLAGSKGVGKSSLMHYLFSELSNRLELPNRCYNVETNGGYFKPYNGAPFGILNEFMALRSDDPFLKIYNQVVSSDPFNFEAASLPGKVQPCQLKLLCLTSNDMSPKLTNVLGEEFAKAVWDRTYRILVEDELCQGRSGQNLHRKSDYSHLKLFITKSTQLTPVKKEECTEITVKQLIDILAYRMMNEELNFLTTQNMEEDSFSLARKDFLVENMNKNDTRDLVSDRIPNSSGQSFFAIRIQGPGGTRKTDLSIQVANNLNKYFMSMEIIKVKNFNDLPLVRAIYIIDDILSLEGETSYEAYFKWVNEGVPGSVYINVSNLVIPSETPLLTHVFNKFTGKAGPTHYDTTALSQHSGIGRRLGFTGNIKHNGVFILGDKTDGCVIQTDSSGSLTIDNTPVSFSDIPKLIFGIYKTHLSKSNGLIIVSERFMGSRNFDVEINSPSFEDLRVSLSTSRNIANTYLNKSPVKLKIAKSAMDYLCTVSTTKQWLVPEKLETKQQVLSLVERMAYQLMKIMPQATFRAIFEKEAYEIIVKDNFVYVRDTAIKDDIQLSRWTYEGLQCLTISGIKTISPSAYALYVTTSTLTDEISDLSYEQLGSINDTFNENTKYDVKRVYQAYIESARSKMTIKDMAKSAIYDHIRTHKAVYILGAIVSAIGFSYAGFKLYKYFSKSTKPNADASDGYWEKDENFRNLKDYFKNNFMKSDFNRQDFNKKVEGMGYKQHFNEWEQEWRSNSQITRDRWNTAIMVADVKDISTMIQINPKRVEEILTIKPNALSLMETSAQTNSNLESFLHSMKKQYVRVYNTRTQNTNYGLGIRGNILLTVAHVKEKSDDTIVVFSNGNRYDTKVLKVNNSRDLMFLEITNKEFQSFRDIKKHLMSSEDYDNIQTAFYCRPTETPLIHGCMPTYIKKMTQPITSSYDPNFKFSEGVICVQFIKVKDILNIIKEGDCGFPLIALCQNQFKIIGLHNALGVSQDALFSAISITDYNIVSIKPNSAICHMKDEQVKYVTLPSYEKALTNLKQSRYEKLGLSVLGFSPDLFMRSQPKFKKIKVKIPGAKTTCSYVPAALSIKDVSDTSQLIKDNSGQYNPLFSQSMKYTKKTEEYGKWNEDTRKIVKNLITTRYKLEYDEPKLMNMHHILNGEPETGNHPFEAETSAGPYFKLKHILTKEGLLDNLAEEGKAPYYKIKQNQYGEELKDQYRLYCDAIDNGEPILLITKDNAKVELLPEEKVRKGKVRLFSEIDFSLNMVLKRYFGHFIKSVIDNHHDSCYKMGMNPYLEASEIMLKMNLIDGPIISTDISGCDKSMCKEIISDFVECVLYNFDPKIQRALAKTLTNTVHILDGHIYLLDCGNESGSYVTTIMNCFAMEMITLYPIVEAFYNIHGRYPTLSDINFVAQYIILGDDRAMKIDKNLNINFNEIQKAGRIFNFDVTVAKIESDSVSFCSRVFRKSPIHPLIYIPALKEESIVASIHWYVQETNSMIAQNINISLFEASLHPKEFFDKVFHDALSLVKKYNIQQLIDMLTYEEYNLIFHRYVEGRTKHPTLMVLDNQETLIKFSDFMTNSNLNKSIKQKFIMDIDANNWLNNYLQNNGRNSYKETFTSSGGDESPTWECCINYNEFQQRAFGSTKKLAKAAAVKLLRLLIMDCSNYKPNSGKGADMPIEPATINQSATASQTARLPAAANPQPTAITPAMTSTGEDVMAALQNTPSQCLNPVGAPNMLSVGAITFDVKDLIYQQYLDCDTEFQITDDKPSGTIIFQIPYGINTEFNNKYIKAYGNLHERYAGSLKYRLTVIGNQLFSGSIGVAWSPKKILTATAPISELQKYAYNAKGLQYMWNDIMTLHDARDELFYRTVDETSSNFDKRPHLVVFLMMSIQNPLKEGAITRIRVASKLSGAIEENPFTFSNPDLPAPPTVQQESSQYTAIPTQISTMTQTFPQILSYKTYTYTDGVFACPQKHDETSIYRLWDMSSLNRCGYGGKTNASLYDNDSRIQQITPSNLLGANWQISGSSADTAHMTWWTNMPAKNWKTIQVLIKALYREDADIFKGPEEFMGAMRVVAALTNNDRIDQAKILCMYRYVAPTGSDSSGGGFKIVTDYGLIYVSIYGQPDGPQDSFRWKAILSQTEFPSENYNDQDSVVFYNSGLINALPAGYNVLRMTEQAPSSLPSDAFYSSARDNDTILRYFISLAKGVDTNQCYQFELIDSISKSRVMSVRFLNEYNIFVINNPLPNKYALCPLNLEQLDIINLNLVPRTNSFPLSDTTNWINRQSGSYIKRLEDQRLQKSVGSLYLENDVKLDKEQVKLHLENANYKPNASLALGMLGGAMGGVGQAIGQNQQYKFQEQQQKNQHEHNLEYQGNMFKAQSQWQQKDQEFAKMMNNTMFNQAKDMSAIQTHNQLAMRGFSTNLSGVTKGQSNV